MNPVAIATHGERRELCGKGQPCKARHGTYVRGRMASQNSVLRGVVERLADMTLWLVRCTRIPGRTNV